MASCCDFAGLTSTAGSSPSAAGKTTVSGRLLRALAGDDSRLVAHEAIHVEQWRRLGWAPFLVVYLGEYLRGRLAGLPHAVAYRSISLEQEAEQRSALARGGR